MRFMLLDIAKYSLALILTKTHAIFFCLHLVTWELEMTLSNMKYLSSDRGQWSRWSIKDLLHGRERRFFGGTNTWKPERGRWAHFAHLRIHSYDIIRSLSNNVFERGMSTGSGLFALFSRDFEQIRGQNVCLRVKKLSNINWVASR